MKKRVFIIHGWSMNPGSGWYAWLAKNLREQKFLVETPEMPDTDNPKIESWTDHIRKVVGRCDENTFFVGHSIGCQAIMRYLEKLSNDEKAGGAVFVAPWLTLTGLKEEEERIVSSPWINTPIDFEKVRMQAKKLICVFSDNDPYVPKENQGMFSEELEAEIIIEEKKSHFTEEDEVRELPIVLESVLKIAMK